MSGRSGTATCALGANPSAIKRGRRLPYCLLLIALLLGAAILRKDGGAGFPTAKPRSNAQWAHLYAALPLSFEANRGQTDPSVSFLSRGRGYALFLTGQRGRADAQELVVRLSSGQKPPASAAALRLQVAGRECPARRDRCRENCPAKPITSLATTPANGDNVPTYAKVRYESVYPGVDLVYYGTQGGELEYDFVVAPGADPNAIALGCSGGYAPLRPNSAAETAATDSSRATWSFQLPSGECPIHKPVIYQTQDSSESTIDHRQSTIVEGHYALDAQNHVRFELGPYDHNRPLVIDPVLIYATYMGGTEATSLRHRG